MPRHDGDSIVAWSLHAPYAGAVADRAKPIETRKWWTDFRGDVVIHGALKVDHEATQRLGDRVTKYLDPLLRGVLLAVVRIANARALLPSDEEKALFFAENRIAFELENVRLLRPLPWKGHQGPFLVPRAVIDDALQGAPTTIEEFIEMRREAVNHGG